MLEVQKSWIPNPKILQLCLIYIHKKYPSLPSMPRTPEITPQLSPLARLLVRIYKKLAKASEQGLIYLTCGIHLYLDRPMKKARAMN